MQCHTSSNQPTQELHVKYCQENNTPTARIGNSTNQEMDAEVIAASNYITYLLRTSKFNDFSNRTLKKFNKQLIRTLKLDYHGHWFTKNPSVGNAYRCIIVNKQLDSRIKKAAQGCDISVSKIHYSLPLQLYVWCDPKEISVKFGENGGICTIYRTDSMTYFPWARHQAYNKM